MREHMSSDVDQIDRHEHQRRMAALAAVVVITFVVLAGINLDSARQVFDATLGETIKTVEAGSAIRQIALFGFAAFAIAFVATGPHRQPEIKPIIAVPLGLFVTMISASTLWAIDPGLTFRRAAAIGLMLIGVYACAQMLDMRHIVAGTLLFTGAFVAAAVAAQFVVGTFTPAIGSWRLAGIVHPVALSWYCGLGTLAAVAVARFEPVYRIPASWAAIAFMVGLMLTKTRTGLGATLAGMAVFWLLTSKRRLHQDIPVVVTWFALIVFLLALALPGDHFSWNSIYSDSVEASSLGRTDAIEQIATFTGRLPVWEASLALASERPILGFGYSAFQSPDMIPVLAEAAGWVPTSTHSGYIDALLSLGIVGLGLVRLLSRRIDIGIGPYGSASAALCLRHGGLHMAGGEPRIRGTGSLQSDVHVIPRLPPCGEDRPLPRSQRRSEPLVTTPAAPDRGACPESPQIARQGAAELGLPTPFRTIRWMRHHRGRVVAESLLGTGG